MSARREPAARDARHLPELRKDPVTGRWVIISTERRKRPATSASSASTLVGGDLLPVLRGPRGHDAARGAGVPPERRRGRTARAGTCGSCPNKFPALQVEGDLDREGEGLFDKMNGIGAHEVIIETPDHDETLATMPEAGDRAGAVGVPRARAGPEAGPAVPLHPDLQEPRRGGRRVARALALAADRAADRAATTCATRSTARGGTTSAKERCVFCDIVRQELADGRRVIHENADIVALSPYAPRFPFETWILPRRHGARFEDAPRHEYESLARMLKATCCGG